MHDPPKSYTDLYRRKRWPLSQMFHENTKLTPHRNREFQEQVANYSQSEDALRKSASASKDYTSRDFVELPEDSRWTGRRLRDILRTRRTRRGQSVAEPLTLGQWGSLLNASCGITGSVDHPEIEGLQQELRAWPSGGALYPIETYVIPLCGRTPSRAIYHYDPQRRRLWRIAESPTDDELALTIFAEGLWRKTAALVVLTGVFARNQVKYGERGYRIVLLDAGHLAQNLLLSCEDLRLNAVPLGGFDDDRLARMMGLDSQQEGPLYVMMVSPSSRG